MTRLISFSFLFLCCILQSAAQANRLPSKVKVGKPEVLKPRNGICKFDDLKREISLVNKWGTKKTVNDFWTARSDRSKNQVYADAYRVKTLDVQLAFNQQVVICEVKGDMALVYEDNKLEHFPVIPSYAKYIGWVPIENLLLWDDCPTDQRGVRNRALLGINLNRIGWGKEFKGKVYKAPDTDEDARDMEADLKFYFIMKVSKDGKRILLCENSIVFGNNLYGWVDDNAVTAWNHRACIEPNWDASFARSHKWQQVGMYANPSMTPADKVASWEFGNPNGYNDLSSQFRMAPSQLRFPVIGKVDPQTNRIHSTFFMDRTGKTNFGKESSEANEEVKRIQQLRRQLNVIFVVEATTEMRMILPAVKAALPKCQSLGDSGVQVRAGVVLYRSATQGRRGVEVVPLTSYDNRLLLSKLVSAKANARLSSKVAYTALDLALQQASDGSKMGFLQDQKNLIIVIGSHGSPKADSTFTAPTLLAPLANHNIQVMSIQVTKNQTGGCAAFNDQMSLFIKANVNRQYEDIGLKADARQREEGDGLDFHATSTDDVLFAQMRHPTEQGKPLSAASVTEYIEKGITAFAEAASNLDQHYEKTLGVIQFDPTFIARHLGTAAFENWKENRFISLFDGYVPISDKDGNPYWRYVILLSGDELLKLLDDLKPAYQAARQQPNDRKPYTDAIRTLLRMRLGQANDKGIDNIDEDQLQVLLYGIDVHADRTKLRKLKDILNPQAVSDKHFKEMLANFTDNYDKLQKLYSDGYTYRTKLGMDWYYWIPIEDLP